MSGKTKLRRYQAPIWSEPIIMEMGRPGQRGILIPKAGDEVGVESGEWRSHIPKHMRRQTPPRLPEIAQPQVLRHFEHLAQMTLGMEENIDISTGTATMKYSPKVNEVLARMPQVSEIHPHQDESTIQGVLEIIYKLGLFLSEISGIDHFTFQPPGGSVAVFLNACLLKAYHYERGELECRNEIITTIFTHPCIPATASAAGFKVIHLMPDSAGYPDLEALEAACSEKTAGLMITNPEDTGIFNPRIREFVQAVHNAGGLCFYDQANANGILGITRAREAGFDACHFNLHKTFSCPHGSYGPGCGAYGVREGLQDFLPRPIVRFDGNKFRLDWGAGKGVKRVREFFGNFPAALRAYSWIMAMGEEGLREVAKTSVLNNNYLAELLLAIKGVELSFPQSGSRLEQARYSLRKLKEETGCGTEDVQRRMVDFGVQSYFMSHHPWIVPEPFTPEPCESYSKEDCDYWAAVLGRVCAEAYENPELLKEAPHLAPIHRLDPTPLDDPDGWAMTWRAYCRKRRESR
jgi:glycine dehydrogenase subunit 2